MRRTTRKARLIAVTVLTAAIAGAGGAGSAGAGADPITLTFQSLAFQEATVAATESIVADWNEANPDVQVEIRQGSWDNVNDELVTQFAGGSAPDIIHYESAGIAPFATQGYLADLSGLLSEDTTAAVSEDVWGTVTTADGAVVAAPTLMQSYVVFANTDAIEAAGAEVPTGETLSWDDFQALASTLTTDDQAGLGWGLKSPTASIMNLALGFGGDFFTTEGEETTFEAGDAEMEVPSRIHAMAYEDGSIDQLSLSLSGSDALAGFTAGDYAMFVGGNFYAQQLTTDAPDFAWAVLPPLEGSEGANQAANPQTMSVSAESEHVEEAAAFIDFFMGADNLAALAQGDALIPTTEAAREVVAEATGGENGWDAILASGEHLVAAPFQSVLEYTQWKDEEATPAFQEYFADSISLEELQARLTDGWDKVSG
ncbi:MAG: extracellular solute-binding protein [Actinomycetota bacterium]|nr:extracellular solute-binding protein [Actinomycetota bacterium]